MDNDDFVYILEQHSRRLYLIAFSYTKSHFDAEDIVQDVFLKLWKKDITFNDNEHLKRWLTVLCVNKSKDYIKSSFFKRNTSLDSAADLYTFDKPVDYDIFSAVMSLPKNGRVIIHLYYYEELSVKEIANILKLSESTVKTRLYRARKKLKDKLGDEWINEQ